VIAAGSAAGAVVFAAISTIARGLFSVPGGGVGYVTATGYPKGFDYWVVAMIIAGAVVGGIAAGWGVSGQPRETREPGPYAARSSSLVTIIASLAVFVLMFLIHDHPYLQMEPFHEGEHLTPAFLFKQGARPFGDVFLLHGLAVDGGLDALVLGDPPSPRHERRLETVLDAGTLALLVPIAAEVCATPAGALLAALAALCATGAGQVPVFPYFRLAPLLLAVLALLRYARTRGSIALFGAMSASTLGLLWSLDIGLYALATTILVVLALRAWRPWLIASALALPVFVLLVLHADIGRFVMDSFVVIPRAIDAIWSLPMRTDLSWESARYFVPPAFYGLLLVLAFRAHARGERDAAVRLAVIALASLFAFRSAAGRCGWSHTRYGVPLIGVAFVAFVAEPLALSKRWILTVVVTVAIVLHVDLVDNARRGAKLLTDWRGRQSHAGLVPYPLRTGRGIYTTPENASDLSALQRFVNDNAPPDAPLLDVSNERALLYLLERRPATRCNDIAMLSTPPLLAEAMQQLAASPPPVVIVSGAAQVDLFDNLPNRARVPSLFAWIDANYPRRRRVGRFVVATK
jgi:hypothetical protein